MPAPFYSDPIKRYRELYALIRCMMKDASPSDVFATLHLAFYGLAENDDYNKRTQEVFHALSATAYLSEFISFD